MTDSTTSADALHTKFSGEATYRDNSQRPSVWKAVKLLSEFVDKPNFVTVEPSDGRPLHLRALTPTHLYTVSTDDPPAVMIHALHLTRLLVRGDPTHDTQPFVQVALHMPDDGGDPVVLIARGTYTDRRQLDELLALLPMLRDAVR